ncbi:MAG: hypothetical protein LBD47_08470 [Treponema sp.]|jgi:uncharacterized membrane protein|nr:hypothetical protein [Treponema sp.]
MDTGQMVFMFSRLILGALASFFAIMLWSKTRDVAWMLLVIGAIAAYIETVYAVLNLFGITGKMTLFADSLSLPAVLLPILHSCFFIAAFLIMVVRRYRCR